METLTDGPPKAKRHRSNKCSYTGCDFSKQSRPSLHFFRFPVRRPEVCKRWLFNYTNIDFFLLQYPLVRITASDGVSIIT